MSVFSKFLAYPQENAASAPRFTSRVLYELPYIGEGKHVQMTDLFLPKNKRQNRPVILHIHGGAWTKGSRLYTRGYCDYLASQGFAVLTADYTPIENADLPTQVRDVIAAMRYVRSNASVYGFDPDAVFLTGDSVGALLVMLAYIVGHDSTLRLLYGAEEVPFTAKAFGLASPVTDLHFVTDGAQSAQRELCEKLFGKSAKETPLFYCSSVKDVLRPAMHLPPVWIVSSEDDFFSGQSVDLHHVLNRRNVENRLRFVSASDAEPLGHGFPVLDPARAESKTVNDEMIAFFRAQM